MNSIDMFRSGLPADEDSPPSTALARGLGWFSIALGAFELAAPRLLARGIGIEPGVVTSAVTRVMGAREIAAGISVLLQPRKPWPLWARVAGDALDLALLGIASTRRTSSLRLAGAFAAVGGVTALDVIAGLKTQRAHANASRPVIYAVTIAKPPKAVYDYFRNFSQLPVIMDYLEEVSEEGKISHWVAKPILGNKTVSWDAEIVDDIPGQIISWQSVEDSAIQVRGRVTFAEAPAGTGTEVRVEMELGFKGLGTSTVLAKLFSKPQIKGDLRRLKQVLETGEVLISDATVTRKPHPAQPSEPDVIAQNPHAAVSKWAVRP